MTPDQEPVEQEAGDSLERDREMLFVGLEREPYEPNPYHGDGGDW